MTEKNESVLVCRHSWAFWKHPYSYMEARRRQRLTFSISPTILPWDNISHWNGSLLFWLGWLVSKAQGSCVFPIHYLSNVCSISKCWIPGMWIQVRMHGEEVFLPTKSWPPSWEYDFKNIRNTYFFSQMYTMLLMFLEMFGLWWDLWIHRNAALIRN